MSTTALVWVIAYSSGAALSFFHPIFGLSAYFLDYYAHPPLRWWGKDLPDLRWSLIIAVITFLGLLIRQNKLPELKIKSHPQNKWLVLLVVTAVIISFTPLAVWKDKSWESAVELIKLAVLYFLIVKTIRTKDHFRYIILIQILGVFAWGWNAFDDPQIKAGRLVNIGGPDSLDDNGAAAHILTILPLMGVLFLTGKWWEKFICLAAVPFALNALILCNSRGAFVSLILVGIVAIFISYGSVRWKIVAGIVVAGIVFYNLMGPQFIERQKTLQTFKDDPAATGRLKSWAGALDLITDHPLGTGGGGYDALSPQYIPEIVAAHGGKFRTVHNSYLLIASEWGLLGFFFFMAFLWQTLLQLNGIRKVPVVNPEGKRIRLESLGIMLGLLGMLFAGIFINRAYSEPIYWMSALSSVLSNIQAKTKEDQEAKTES